MLFWVLVRETALTSWTSNWQGRVKSSWNFFSEKNQDVWPNLEGDLPWQDQAAPPSGLGWWVEEACCHCWPSCGCWTHPWRLLLLPSLQGRISLTRTSLPRPRYFLIDSWKSSFHEELLFLPLSFINCLLLVLKFKSQINLRLWLSNILASIGLAQDQLCFSLQSLRFCLNELKL